MLQHEQEAQRRRTFAIISHPDAGKTTLTEKLLLYSGSIHLAGSVKSRRASRHAVSDWMKMEQERGISITTSVLQFNHRGSVINLLDTPGHADFSEDTSRTLAAVDAAVMLIDHAKGVEGRTRKLFEVCRMRKLPVVTFINKLDREGLDPLGLLDEVSNTLNLKVVPMNWPIGMGRDFRGVVDRRTGMAWLFSTDSHGTERATLQQMPMTDIEPVIGERLFAKLQEELDLLNTAGDDFTREAFLAGDVSPVFFGSAMSNFGIEPLLNYLADDLPGPGPKETTTGEMIAPSCEKFSGFVFKIQANMDPKHRDRVAFVRVVSGHFVPGIEVKIARSGETVRLAQPTTIQADERVFIENAFPGDIVGLYDPGKFRIGDTLSIGLNISFAGIPRFAPEYFGRLTLEDPLKRKALDLGLEQLAHEGVIQPFYPSNSGGRMDTVLGAVGLLQFEVLRERLKHEYRVQARFEPLSYRFARWIAGPPEAFKWLAERKDYIVMKDRTGRLVLLSDSPWPLQYAEKNAPGLVLHEVEPI